MGRKELLQSLKAEYGQRCRKSKKRYESIKNLLISGGSHNLRLFFPFPFFDEQSSGAYVTDIDGNTYTDFWQGHFANILGHNPKAVLDELQNVLDTSQGLITGFPGIRQGELAGLLLQQVGSERIRFTTSGTLATMYAIMLARAFTGRDRVMKVGGGWHGAHPFALKGISTYEGGFDRIESAGLPQGLEDVIRITRYNDLDSLERCFTENGKNTACFIMEPFVGSGGFIFSSMQYLRRARDLCDEYGALLIADEVVSAFRFHPGGLTSLYGVTPDLSVFGKIVGGGMPVSAVCGRREVMELCGPRCPVERRVMFNGGTFSAHPASMGAGCAMLTYLTTHADEVYGKIGALGETARNGIEEVFRTHGFNVRCTGYPLPGLSQSSVVGVHFLKKDIDMIDSPDQVWDPSVCDIELRETFFRLAMMNEGFFTAHGYGAISFSHTREDIKRSIEAAERIAVRWKKNDIQRER
ncbi:MAG: aminotransferase class III-fold pyridoxal phosphate-dependent enzyme [Spirochaetes bacterium]|nr:aminotransferase class III-fold pyridoxal phosphate-dependent enzyme [Spirochaetota bacterium]